MLVRIRFKQGPALRRERDQNRHLALALGALLVPASLMAIVLGLWGLAAEHKWVVEFPISSGLFAGWQSWVGAAALLQICAALLNRYGRGGGAQGT
jgi:hypothetical protein